jgi:hypothetical protein
MLPKETINAQPNDAKSICNADCSHNRWTAYYNRGSNQDSRGFAIVELRGTQSRWYDFHIHFHHFIMSSFLQEGPRLNWDPINLDFYQLGLSLLQLKYEAGSST